MLVDLHFQEVYMIIIVFLSWLIKYLSKFVFPLDISLAILYYIIYINYIIYFVHNILDFPSWPAKPNILLSDSSQKKFTNLLLRR